MSSVIFAVQIDFPSRMWVCCFGFFFLNEQLMSPNYYKDISHLLYEVS